MRVAIRYGPSILLHVLVTRSVSTCKLTTWDSLRVIRGGTGSAVKCEDLTLLVAIHVDSGK